MGEIPHCQKYPGRIDAILAFHYRQQMAVKVLILRYGCVTRVNI